MIDLGAALRAFFEKRLQISRLRKWACATASAPPRRAVSGGKSDGKNAISQSVFREKRPPRLDRSQDSIRADEGWSSDQQRTRHKGRSFALLLLDTRQKAGGRRGDRR